MTGPRPGILHQYTSRLTVFEHTPLPNSPSPPNLIIFIGGLFDGLLTVPYTIPLAASLPPTWSLANILLSSSYNQWGSSSLQQDVAEISKCVAYFRSFKAGKIVLMGHSTGCQDVMEYLTGSGAEKREKVDGGIVQASVSDREAVVSLLPPGVYDESCAYAKKMIEEGRGNDSLPTKHSQPIFQSTAPISASRLLSLLSPNHDGDDDYFSSDLTDAQLFKSFGSLPAHAPLCILFSGADEYVPESVDKEALVERWISVVKQGTGRVDEVNSGILDGGSHNLKGNEDAVVELIKRVNRFISGLGEQANL